MATPAMSQDLSRVAVAIPLLFALLGACALVAQPLEDAVRREPLPPVMAWSWDRSEDLSFLDQSAGVALVTQSVELEGTLMRVRPRRASLTLSAGARVLPVVHVDALAQWRPALDASQEDRLVELVVSEAARSALQAVQVDFEALPSQRDFYRRVLQRVRARVPHAYLSITALASWCLGDQWLQDAPVDEVVPMAFRMGSQSSDYRQVISKLARWPASHCTSVGVATDEPAVAPVASRRVYLFSPKPWASAQWHETLARFTARTNNSNVKTTP